MSTDTEELTKGEIFEVLSSSRRRLLLYYLHDRGGRAPLDELAQEIASIESGIPIEELDKQAYKRIYISLYQTHVPNLEKHGLVTYDEEDKRVALTDRIDQVITTVDVSANRQRPWPMYYALLGVVGAGTVGVAQLGLEPFASVPTSVLAIVFALVLVALALVHFYVVQVRGPDRSYLEELVDV